MWVGADDKIILYFVGKAINYGEEYPRHIFDYLQCKSLIYGKILGK